MKIFDFFDKIYLSHSAHLKTQLQTALKSENSCLKATYDEVLWKTFVTLVSDKKWLPALDYPGFLKLFSTFFQLLFTQVNVEYSQPGLWKLFEHYLEKRPIEQIHVHTIRRLAAFILREFKVDVFEKINSRHNIVNFYGGDPWFLKNISDICNCLIDFGNKIFGLDGNLMATCNRSIRNTRRYINSLCEACVYDGTLINIFCANIKMCVDLSGVGFNTPFLAVTCVAPLSLWFLSITSDCTHLQVAREIDFCRLNPAATIYLRWASADVATKFTAIVQNSDTEEICQPAFKGGKNYMFKVKNNETEVAAWVFKNVVLDKHKFSLQVLNNSPVLFFAARQTIYRLELQCGRLCPISTIDSSYQFCQFESASIIVRHRETCAYKRINISACGNHISYVRPDKFPFNNLGIVEYLKFSKCQKYKKFINSLAHFYSLPSHIYFYLPEFSHYFVTNNLIFLICNKLILVV